MGINNTRINPVWVLYGVNERTTYTKFHIRRCIQMDKEEKELINELINLITNIDESWNSIDHEISVICDDIHNIKEIIYKERIGEILERRL